MTKKHYILLAEAMRQTRPMPHWDANKHTQWDMDVRYLADALRSTNPRFDSVRFITWCEKDA